MGHIPTKLYQFLISSFRDFVRTDTQTPPKTIPALNMRAGKNCQHNRNTAYNELQTVLLFDSSSIPLYADNGVH